MKLKPHALINAYTFAIPLEDIMALENAVLINKSYADGKYTYELTKNQNIDFNIIPVETVAAMIAADKLKE